MYAVPLLCGPVMFNFHAHPFFPPRHIVNQAKEHPMEPVNLEGIVTRPVEKRRHYSTLYIKSVSLQRKNRWMPAEGNIRIIINKAELDLQYGDRIIFENLRLRLLRGYMNPGGFNYQAFMARKGIYASGAIWKDGGMKVIARGEGSGFLAALYSFKEQSSSAIDANLPEREAGILKAMILGETWAVDLSDRINFSRSGTAHLLAISGLHVGFAALASYYIILFLLKGVMLLTIRLRGTTFHARRWAALASIFPVVSFAAMVGDRPSATRAAIMVCTYMGARFLDRDKNLYNALALAAMIILVWKPLSILDTGFQLSFLAAFFIIHYIQKTRMEFGAEGSLADKLLKPSVWKQKIMAYVLISVVASLATAPIIARNFNEVSLNAPAVNVLAIPTTSLLVPAGLLASMVNMVSETAARPLFALSSLLSYILRENSSLVAEVSPLSFKVLTPWMPAAAAYYFLLALTMNFWRRGRFHVLLAATSAALILSFCAPYLVSHGDGKLRVTFLDVGEGDAAVVFFPGGRTMVIDTGPSFRSGRDTGQIVVSPYLRSRGVRRIDYLLISHAQRDHAGGAPSLIRDFGVDRLWHNGDRMQKHLNRWDLDHAAPPLMRRLSAEDSMSTRFIDGVKIDVLHPPARRQLIGSRLSENNLSAVIRLTYGNFSVLFPGDIERPVQKKLVKGGADLKATVLKAPHHGAGNALHFPFLSAVSPEVAVISAGKYNRSKHPHPEVLSTYDMMDIEIFRTYRDGAITIVSDGRTYSINTFMETLRPTDIRRILNR